MKPNEQKLLVAVLDGQLYLVGEYRGGAATGKKFADTTDGKAKTGKVMIRHMVETIGFFGVDSILLLQFLPDTVTDPASVKIEWEKGKRYAFPISKYGRDGGKTSGFLDGNREVIPL
ncbi:MAG: hypothetical protein V4584_12550 [Verrucomicrobiota bacterium]